MRRKEPRECTEPRKNDSIPWKVTPVMAANNYSDRLEEEMEEVISAVVLAETYPDKAEWIKSEDEEKEDEEEQI